MTDKILARTYNPIKTFTNKDMKKEKKKKRRIQNKTTFYNPRIQLIRVLM